LLHRESAGQKTSAGDDVQKVNCGNAMQRTSFLCSMIVPVWISTKRDPTKRCLTYAMLDTQSDATYITEEVSARLDGESFPVTLIW
jgi:hypothetical protein